jgi:hypothetical protein
MDGLMSRIVVRRARSGCRGTAEQLCSTRAAVEPGRPASPFGPHGKTRLPLPRCSHCPPQYSAYPRWRQPSVSKRGSTRHPPASVLAERGRQRGCNAMAEVGGGVQLALLKDRIEPSHSGCGNSPYARTACSPPARPAGEEIRCPSNRKTTRLFRQTRIHTVPGHDFLKSQRVLPEARSPSPSRRSRPLPDRTDGQGDKARASLPERELWNQRTHRIRSCECAVAGRTKKVPSTLFDRLRQC